MTDDVVGLLRHAIATASNDDFSKAGSSDRARHTERIDVMAKAADEIDRLTAALACERERAEKAERELFVPGEFCCAKCGFSLSQFRVSAATGQIGDRDDPGEKCPNDGSPLWRVTWKKRAFEHYDRAIDEMHQADTLRSNVKTLKEALGFYSNPARYTADGVCLKDRGPYLDSVPDKGERARSVLKTKDGE